DKVFVTTAVTEKQSKPSNGGGGFGGGGGGVGGGGFGGGPGGGRGRGATDAVYQFKIVCLNAKDGTIVWDKAVSEKKPTIPTHGTNTYASETPITDGERVYAYFGMHGIYCL